MDARTRWAVWLAATVASFVPEANEDWKVIDIYMGDRFVRRMSREEYEEAVEMSKVITPWLDRAYQDLMSIEAGQTSED